MRSVGARNHRMRALVERIKEWGALVEGIRMRCIGRSNQGVLVEGFRVCW